MAREQKCCLTWHVFASPRDATDAVNRAAHLGPYANNVKELDYEGSFAFSLGTSGAGGNWTTCNRKGVILIKHAYDVRLKKVGGRFSRALT